jgi:transcriptional regulator with XRE-family HTH domain
MLTLGEQLAARRNTLGLSIRELAERCNLSPAIIHKLETGQRYPTVRTLEQLVGGLQCTFVVEEPGVTNIAVLIVNAVYLWRDGE